MPQQSASAAQTPAQFVAKWQPVQLSERAASQEHFMDLCRLLGQPTDYATTVAWKACQWRFWCRGRRSF